MKGPMKHLILTALVVMFCTVSLPASASQDSSHCDIDYGSRTIPMQNIILPAGEKKLGRELYNTSKTIKYTCLSVAGSSDNNTYPTLVPGHDLAKNDDKDNLINLLKGAGLGLKLTVSDKKGGKTGSVSWDELKAGSWRAPFGKPIPPPTSTPVDKDCTPTNKDNPTQGDCSYTGTATITLTLYVAADYPESSTVTNMPPKTDVLRIASGGTNPYNTGQIGTSNFAIKILQDGLTVAPTITPDIVNLGHFIKADEASLTRSGKFTVTVRQGSRPAPNVRFGLPLNITFGNGSLQLLDDAKYLALKNTDDAADNGLQLAIRDLGPGGNYVNQLIPFNQDTLMGTLTVTPTPESKGIATHDYAIEVSRRAGMEVRTGKFSGGIPVTITYN
ncbi:TPA: hypothetical protein G8O14_004250 [Salmonella enterica]|nr:hypothetical protein [Salmonella enterica]